MSVSRVNHSSSLFNAIATSFGIKKEAATEKLGASENLFYRDTNGNNIRPVTHGRLVTHNGDLERSIYQDETRKAIGQSCGHEGYAINYDDLFLQGCAALEQQAKAAGFKIPKRISLEYKEREHLKQVASRHENYCQADHDPFLEQTKSSRNSFERKLAVACKRRNYIEALIQKQAQGLSNILEKNSDNTAVCLKKNLIQELEGILGTCNSKKIFISKPHQKQITKILKNYGLVAKENISINDTIKKLESYKKALNRLNGPEPENNTYPSEEAGSELSNEIESILAPLDNREETIGLIKLLTEHSNTDLLKILKETNGDNEYKNNLKERFNSWSSKNNNKQSEKEINEWLDGTLASCRNELEKTYNKVAEDIIKSSKKSQYIEKLFKLKDQLRKVFPGINEEKTKEEVEKKNFNTGNKFKSVVAYNGNRTATPEDERHFEVASRILDLISIKNKLAEDKIRKEAIEEVNKTRDALLKSLIPTLQGPTEEQSNIQTVASRILQQQEEINAAKLIKGSISINSNSCFLCSEEPEISNEETTYVELRKREPRDFTLIQPYGIYLDKDGYIHDCYYQIKKNQDNKYAIFCHDKENHEEIENNPLIEKGGKLIQSLEDMQNYFSEKDTNLLFKNCNSINFSDNLSKLSFEDLAVTHKQHHDIHETITEQVNYYFEQETQIILKKYGIKTVYGSGYSYNAGLYGENHGVNHRQIIYNAIFRLAEKGKISFLGSCGAHQNSGKDNNGRQKADGTKEPGNLTSVQNYTGKLFLSSPRGNDPQTVDDKISTIRVAPHSKRAGFHEKAVFAYLHNNNKFAEGRFFNRNEKALSVPITISNTIEDTSNNTNFTETEEINIPILHPNGSPLIGIDQFKLSEASENKIQELKDSIKIEPGNPPLSTTEQLEKLLHNNNDTALTLELVHELTIPLQNSDKTPFADNEGNPVNQRSSIQVQYNPKQKAFVLNYLEHWDTVPKASASDPHTAELVDIAHTNGHIEQVAVLTYEKSTWGEKSDIGNSPILNQSALKKLTENHLRAAPLSDGFIVKDDAVHTQFVNKKFNDTDNEDSHSIRPNDLRHGKLSIPASSAYHQASHPTAVKPEAYRESGIVTSLEKRGNNTHQPHSDMNKAEGGKAKLNPYTSDPLPDIDPKYWGNRHGNLEAEKYGSSIGQQGAVLNTLKAIFAEASIKAANSSEEAGEQTLLGLIKEKNAQAKENTEETDKPNPFLTPPKTYASKEEIAKVGNLKAQIKAFDQYLKTLEKEPSIIKPQDKKELNDYYDKLYALITTGADITIKTVTKDDQTTIETFTIDTTSSGLLLPESIQNKLLEQGFNGTNGFKARINHLFSPQTPQGSQSASSSSSQIGAGNKASVESQASTSYSSSNASEIHAKPEQVHSKLYTDLEVLQQIIENKPELENSIDNQQLGRLKAIWGKHQESISQILSDNDELSETKKLQKTIDLLIEKESNEVASSTQDTSANNNIDSKSNENNSTPSIINSEPTGYTQSSRSSNRRSFWKNPGKTPVVLSSTVAMGGAITDATASASEQIAHMAAELSNTGQKTTEMAAATASTAAATSLHLGFGALLATMGFQTMGSAVKTLKRIGWTAQRYHTAADIAEQNTLNKAKLLGLTFKSVEDIPRFEEARKQEVDTPAKKHLAEQGYKEEAQNAIIADFINTVADARHLRAKSNLFKQEKTYQWLNVGTGLGYVIGGVSSALGSIAMVSGHALKGLGAAIGHIPHLKAGATTLGEAGKNVLSFSAAPLVAKIAGPVVAGALFIAGLLGMTKTGMQLHKRNGLSIDNTKGDLGVDSGIRRQANLYNGHLKAELKWKLGLWGVFTGSSAALTIAGLVTLNVLPAALSFGGSLLFTIPATVLLASSTLGLYAQTHRERNGKTSTAPEDSLHIRGSYLSTERRLNRLNNNVSKQMGEAIRVRQLGVDALSHPADGSTNKAFQKLFERKWYGLGAHGLLRGFLRHTGMSGVLGGRKLRINGDYDAHAFLAKHMAEDTQNTSKVSVIRGLEMDFMSETTDSEINYLETQQQEYRNELETMKIEEAQLSKRLNALGLGNYAITDRKQTSELTSKINEMAKLIESHETKKQEIEHELKTIDLRMLDLLDMKKSIDLLFNFNDRIMSPAYKEKFDELRWRYLIAFDGLGDVLTEEQLCGLSKLNKELKTNALKVDSHNLEKSESGFMKTWVQGKPVDLLEKPIKTSRVDFTLGKNNAKRFCDIATMASEINTKENTELNHEAKQALKFLGKKKTDTPFDIDHLFARFITIHQPTKMQNEQNSLSNIYLENRRQEINQAKKVKTEEDNTPNTRLNSWLRKIVQKNSTAQRQVQFA